MPPGPALGAFLSSIDIDQVRPYDRVIVLRAQHRMMAYYAAQSYASVASLADYMENDLFPEDPELAWDAAATEIRAALRLTRRAAETELDRAVAVRRRLPRLWEAMRSGSLDWRRAAVIIDGTGSLDEVTARRVVDTVIDEAASRTTGELAAQIRRLCIDIDTDSAADRYHQAVDQRRVVLEPSPDGTANLLGLELPPDLAMKAARRLDALARGLDGQGDTRSLDQRRADVFLDLLCGRHDASAGRVEILVPLDTLANLAEAPGELAGYGPVIADIARQVAERHVDGEWRFTITDPTTGLPVHDGTTRRRPTAAQRRSVEARDRTCTFPGCRVPATQCDLDHRTPWSVERQTCTHGLDAGCRHDHVTVRHGIGWLHELLPGGDHLWISPLGHRYTKSGRRPP